MVKLFATLSKSVCVIMNNTTAVQAAENLQLGVLSSGGQGMSREQMCSIIDEMLPSIKQLLVLNTASHAVIGTSLIMVYDAVGGTWQQSISGVQTLFDGNPYKAILYDNDTLFMSKFGMDILVDLRGGFSNLRTLEFKQPDDFFYDWQSSIVRLPGNTLLALNGAVRTGYRAMRSTRPSHRILDNGTWIEVSRSKLPRCQSCCVVLLSGDVLIAGGEPRHVFGTSNVCFIFHVASRRFTQTVSMMEKRLSCVGCLLNDGRVFVSGGMDLGRIRLRTCEIFNPAEMTWEDGGSMVHGRCRHACQLMDDGRVFIVGGLTYGVYTTHGGECEMYDPATKTSTVANGRMPHELYGITIIPIFN